MPARFELDATIRNRPSSSAEAGHGRRVASADQRTRRVRGARERGGEAGPAVAGCHRGGGARVQGGARATDHAGARRPAGDSQHRVRRAEHPQECRAAQVHVRTARLPGAVLRDPEARADRVRRAPRGRRRAHGRVLRPLRRPTGRPEGLDRLGPVPTRPPDRQHRGRGHAAAVPGCRHPLPGRLADLRALGIRRQVAHRRDAHCRRCAGREGHSPRREPEGRPR